MNILGCRLAFCFALLATSSASARAGEETATREAIERQFAEDRTVAAVAYFNCLEQSKSSGFLGIGTDPTVTCESLRAAYAEFLPAEEADAITAEAREKILSVGARP